MSDRNNNLWGKLKGVLLTRTGKVGVAVAVLIIIAILLLVRGKFRPNYSGIASFEAKRGEFVISITESGELEAKKSVSVSTPTVRGVWRLQIVDLVPEGSEVEKGDFLIQFDASEIEKQIVQKDAEMNIARANLEKGKASQASQMAQLVSSLEDARASYKLAELRLEQMKYEADVEVEKGKLELKKADIALRNAESKIEAQKRVDKAEIRTLELKIKQASEDLKKAQEALGKLTVTASKAGLVVYGKIWKGGGKYEKIKVGDQVWPGMKLIEIPDLAVMQVKTQVNEVDISKIEKGLEVNVKLDAFEEPTFHGKVTEVASLARKKEEESEVKVFDVTVEIQESDPILKPGMTASAEIVVEKIPDVVYVPIEAVFEKEDTTVVYTIGSLPRPTKVKVGKRNDNYVIIEEGLAEGERVALRDPTLELEELGGELPESREKKE
ncbi:MAG: efflux RND transporter periplasmic adaptor subunit [bacterium]